MEQAEHRSLDNKFGAYDTSRQQEYSLEKW